jgi:alpha-beta hydrolase superfamily lysophospholipase
MYAGDDRLVDPAGSQAFASAAPARYVSARCFDDLYHEILNERASQPVYDCLRQWLDAQF